MKTLFSMAAWLVVLVLVAAPLPACVMNAASATHCHPCCAHDGPMQMSAAEQHACCEIAPVKETTPPSAWEAYGANALLTTDGGSLVADAIPAYAGDCAAAAEPIRDAGDAAQSRLCTFRI